KQFPLDQFVFASVPRQRHQLVVGPTALVAVKNGGRFHTTLILNSCYEQSRRLRRGWCPNSQGTSALSFCRWKFDFLQRLDGVFSYFFVLVLRCRFERRNPGWCSTAL